MNDSDIIWAAKHIIDQLKKFGVQPRPLQPNMESQLINSTVIAWKNRIDEAEAEAIKRDESAKSNDNIAEILPNKYDKYDGFTTGGD